MNFGIRKDDRVFISGITGSGKTSLAEVLLEPVKRLIVIDMKDGLQDWNLENYDDSYLRKIKSKDTFRVRITEKEDAFVMLNTAYAIGNVTIYIDEVVALIPEQTKAPQIITDIWQRGRSRNISGWSSSQRPKNVPIVFLSEAQHIFTFRLNIEADRKRIYEVTGDKLVLNKIPAQYQFGFTYYNQRTGQTKLYKKIQLPSNS